MNIFTQTETLLNFTSEFFNSTGNDYGNHGHYQQNPSNIMSTHHMLILIIPALVTSLTTTINSFFTNFSITAWFNWLISLTKSNLTVQPNKVVITQKVRNGSRNDKMDDDERLNGLLILAVLDFITENNKTSKETTLNLKDDGTGISENARMKTRTIHSIPTNTFKYKQMDILYTKSSDVKKPPPKKDGDNSNDAVVLDEVNYGIKITSFEKSTDEIREFIKSCYALYIDKIVPTVSNKVLRYCYYQKKSTHDCKYPLFRRFKFGYCDPKTAFDELFIPQHHIDNIMVLLNKFKSGKLKKLFILTTGIPGCGKTSLKRAIVNYLDTNPVVAKLSNTRNDDDLMDLFFSESLHHANDDWWTVPINERTYIFEDADAESKTLFCREKAKESGDKDDDDEVIVMNKDGTVKMSSKEESSKVTMSGYLNATDGLLQGDGISILMSTNHPELLDAAVKRHGRVTYHINLVKMKAVDAKRMIKYYIHNMLIYGVMDDVREKSLCSEVDHMKIDDDLIVPADLQAICQKSKSIDDVKAGIKELKLTYAKAA
jgi:hypothetical protein